MYQGKHKTNELPAGLVGMKFFGGIGANGTKTEEITLGRSLVKKWPPDKAAVIAQPLSGDVSDVTESCLCIGQLLSF